MPDYFEERKRESEAEKEIAVKRHHEEAVADARTLYWDKTKAESPVYKKRVRKSKIEARKIIRAKNKKPPLTAAQKKVRAAKRRKTAIRTYNVVHDFFYGKPKRRTTKKKSAKKK
jgi:hypothetical protein